MNGVWNNSVSLPSARDRSDTSHPLLPETATWSAARDPSALIEEIRKAAVNNRLSCGAAHDLSARLQVSLREIGEVCNGLKIKISNCQLGCF